MTTFLDEAKIADADDEYTGRNNNSYYDKVPVCPQYHPNSELRKKPGCYPNVSEEQLQAVREVKRIVEEEGLNFNSSNEMEFLKILRFLRARKFNVALSMEMIRNNVKWREESNINDLHRSTADDVLQCDLSLVYKYFPTWVQGFDKQDRPVAWRGFGRFEIWNVLKLTSMEKLLHFHAWETEQMLRIMHEKSQETGQNVETFTVVVDAAGWGVRLATSDAFAFIKGMASTDSDHYPERLGMVVVINAPSMLSWAWRIIQAFLDDVTKAKVKIMGCDPNEWQPVLFSLIDRDQIPHQYGGYAVDIPSDDALSSLNPPASVRTPHESNGAGGISVGAENKKKGGRKKSTTSAGAVADDESSVISKASRTSRSSVTKTQTKKSSQQGGSPKAAATKVEEGEKKKTTKKNVITEDSGASSGRNATTTDGSTTPETQRDPSSSSSRNNNNNSNNNTPERSPEPASKTTAEEKKKKTGWISKVVMCTTPVCNKGDEDFDYVIEQQQQPAGTETHDFISASMSTDASATATAAAVVAVVKVTSSDACTQTDPVAEDELEVLKDADAASHATTVVARSSNKNNSNSKGATASKPRTQSAPPASLSFSTIPATAAATPDTSSSYSSSSYSTSSSTGKNNKKILRNMFSKLLFGRKKSNTIEGSA